MRRLYHMLARRFGLAHPPPVFSVPENTRIYAVGDIHGRSGLLKKMLDAIEEDARQYPGEKIIQVFLGDYIDRGFHSRQVIDLLLEAPPAGQERVCLLGNHEMFLLEFLKDPAIFRSWLNFGGYATLASYGVRVPSTMSADVPAQLQMTLKQNLPARHEQFLRDLLYSYEVGDYFFVHAGVRPGMLLEDQNPEEFLWIRKPFLDHKGFFEKYIVHGHSPVMAPEELPNRANIDVSGASKDTLCCLMIEPTHRKIILVTDDKTEDDAE